MASPLDTIAGDIFHAFNGVFYAAVLTRNTAPVTSPDFDPADPPPPVQTTYTCRALITKYADRFRFDGLVHVKDRKVLILANSLSVSPVMNDLVTVSGNAFVLSEDINIDPALACWVCRGRMS